MREAEGEIKKGQKLTVFIQPSESGGMKFKPTILGSETNRELRWRGSLPIPGLFTGEHIFTIKQLDKNRFQFIYR